jgi:hypothetical protein
VIACDHSPRPRTPSEQQYSDRKASLAMLSRELAINPKTVAKWRKRATVDDLKTGRKAPHSTTLSEAEEAMVVAFRRHTLLPLACAREGGGLPLCLAAVASASHPVSTASVLTMARHLPPAGHRGRQAKRQRFKRYPIGFFHIGIALGSRLPKASFTCSSASTATRQVGGHVAGQQG